MAFHLNEALVQLTHTPITLRAWFSGLPEAWLHADEGPETFSPRDVLAHLIYGERVDWLPRVRTILEQGDSVPFEPFDRRGFLDEARSWTLEALLSEFATLREKHVAEVAALNLSSADLQRRGRHPSLGSVTLEHLLAAWVVHDLDHMAQIARVMAKRYGAEVGPWRNYLPVLTR